MTDDTLELYDLYRVIREEWRWLIGISAAAMVLSVVTALLMTEIYRAQAVVSPVSDRPDAGGASALARQFGGLAGLAGIDVAGLSSGSNELALPYLQSRAIVEEFIRREDLIPILYEDSDSDEPQSLWRATRHFRDNILAVVVDQRTGIITVSVEWTDPEIATEWANGIVALANENLRVRASTEAERNIAYLNEQIEQTSVVGLQQVMFNLVEQEMQTMMLANVREEYAFAIVDPAVPPELRSRPHRSVIVILGTILGGFAAILFIGLRRLLRKLRAQDKAVASDSRLP